MLKKLLFLSVLILFSPSFVFAKTTSENIIFLEADGMHYLNYTSTRTDYETYNIWLEKNKSVREFVEPFLYMYPNDYRLDQRHFDYDLLKFEGGSYSGLRRKVFKPSQLSMQDGVFSYTNWDGKTKTADGNYGIWHSPKNFNNFTYVWVFPKNLEVLEYKANKNGKWTQKDNTIAFYAKDVNNLVFNIRYKEKPPVVLLENMLSITGPNFIQEGQVAKDYRVTLSKVLKNDITVFLKYDGVASLGKDFKAPSSVSIKAGERFSSFDLEIFDDNLAETNENFLVKIAGAKGDKAVNHLKVNDAFMPVQTSILDEQQPFLPDESTALVHLSGPSTLKENTKNTFKVKLNQAPTESLQLNLHVKSTAIKDEDFRLPKSVIIQKGKTEASFVVEVLDDNLLEGAENINLWVEAANNAGFEDLRVLEEHATVALVLEDEAPLKNSDAQTAFVSLEGPTELVEGFISQEYSVQLSQEPLEDVLVSLGYAGNANKEDYVQVKEVRIRAGEQKTTFTLESIDDNLLEGKEEIEVFVKSVKGGGLEDIRFKKQSIITALLNEETPQSSDAQTAFISLSAPKSIQEGSVNEEFYITSSQTLQKDLHVFLQFEGLAKNGLDFKANKKVLLKKGQTQSFFRVEGLDDNFAEGSESFSIKLTKLQGGGLEDLRLKEEWVEVSINDEEKPQEADAQTAFASLRGPKKILEGEEAKFEVVLNQKARDTLSFALSFEGLAEQGEDFTATKELEILKGEQKAFFTVSSLDDNFAEGVEELVVKLKLLKTKTLQEEVSQEVQEKNQDAQKGFLASFSKLFTKEQPPQSKLVTKTINKEIALSLGGFEDVRVKTAQLKTALHDESTPKALHEQTALVSLEGPKEVIEGSKTALYTVHVNQKAQKDIDINLAYAGAASASTDFQALKHVRIAKGEQKATFTLQTLDDNYQEGAEALSVSLAKLKGGGFEDLRINKKAQSVQTALLDESRPQKQDAQSALVSIEGPAKLIEGQSAQAYTLSLSQKPLQEVKVSLAYSGEAKQGLDFEGVKQVRFKKGQQRQTFFIKTLDDNFAEDSERLEVSLQAIEGGSLEDLRINQNKAFVVSTLVDEKLPKKADKQTAFLTLLGPKKLVEGQLQQAYTLRLNQVAQEELEVSLQTKGEAKEAKDFTSVQKVRIKKGEQHASFFIDTLDDNLAEGKELFQLQLGAFQGGGFEDLRLQNASLEIALLDEQKDRSPQSAYVSLSGVSSIEEGQKGSFVVRVDQTPSKDLSLTLAHKGEASKALDFLAPQKLLLKKGKKEMTFNVESLHDNYEEGSEGLTLSLAGVEGGGFESVLVAPKASLVTTNIVDERTSNLLGVKNSLVSTTKASDGFSARLRLQGPQEIVEGERSQNYTLSLSHKAVKDLEVQLHYSGSAQDTQDFLKQKKILLKKGSKEASFRLQTLDDNLAEKSESLHVSIASLQGGGFEELHVLKGFEQVNTEIIDEAVPKKKDKQSALLSIFGPQSIIEGEKSSAYTLELNQAPSEDVRVQLHFSGVAKEGLDFESKKELLIHKNTKKTQFSINTLDDNFAESSELYKVSIASMSKGGFEDFRVAKKAVSTSILDEQKPKNSDLQTAFISLVGASEIIEGQKAGFSVHSSQAPLKDLTVSLVYKGSAEAQKDFKAIKTLTLKKGQKQLDFHLESLDDNYEEGSENLNIAIKAISNGGFEDVRINKKQNLVASKIIDERPANLKQADIKMLSIPQQAATKATALLSIQGPKSVIEGKHTKAYTLKLSQKPKQELVVTLSYKGSAQAGSDYQQLKNIRFKKAQQEASFKLETLDDNLAEKGERIELFISALEGGGFEELRLVQGKEAVITAVHDEKVPKKQDKQTALVTLQGPKNITEGKESAFYKLSLNQVAKEALAINLAFAGSAKVGSDFTPLKQVLIPKGAKEALFSLQSLDDNFAEKQEELRVSIKALEGGGFEDLRIFNKEVLTNIVDENIPKSSDTQTAFVSLSGATTITEGRQQRYTLTLSQIPRSAVEVTLNYSGEAANKADFKGVNKVRFQKGQSKASFDVFAKNDNYDEGSETLKLKLLKVSGGGFEDLRLMPAQHELLAAIHDERQANLLADNKLDIEQKTKPGTDTALLSFSGPKKLTEGKKEGVYTFSLNQVPRKDVEIKLSYSAQAQAGIDFQAPQKVVIKKGKTQTQFKLKSLDDNIAEKQETLRLRIDSLQGGGFENLKIASQQRELVTFLEDEQKPKRGDTQTAFLNLRGAKEVLEGEQSSTYTLTLSQAAHKDLDIGLSYKGLAKENTDFIPVKTVRIKKGSKKTHFSLQSLDDNIKETKEVFEVHVSRFDTGGFEDLRLQNALVRTSILDEGKPQKQDTQTALLSLSGANTLIEGKAELYTLSLNQKVHQDLLVYLAYEGNAEVDGDFKAVQKVRIKKGEKEAHFKLQSYNDNYAEGKEDIAVYITRVEAGGFEDLRLKAKSSALTIALKDERQPNLENKNASIFIPLKSATSATALLGIRGPKQIIEGEKNKRFNISLDQTPKEPVHIELFFKGKAEENIDFKAPRTLTLKAGNKNASFALKSIDDNAKEGKEELVVGIKAIEGGGFEDLKVAKEHASWTLTLEDEKRPRKADTQTALLSISGPKSIREGSKSEPYTLSLNQAPHKDLTLALSYSGEAGAKDFKAQKLISIKKAQKSARFSLESFDDNIAEGKELLQVRIQRFDTGGFEDIRLQNTLVNTSIVDELKPVKSDTQTAFVSLEGETSIQEGAKQNVYINLSQAAVKDLHVGVSYEGLAQEGKDFKATKQVLIKKGNKGASFSLRSIDDNIAEKTESLNIKLASIHGGGFEDVRLQNANLKSKIVDEAKPAAKDSQTALLSFFGPKYVSEAKRSKAYTLSLNQKAEKDLILGLFYEGSAGLDKDYEKVKQVIIKKGERKAHFSINTIDDAHAEDPESILISVASIVGGGFEDLRLHNKQVKTVILDEEDIYKMFNTVLSKGKIDFKKYSYEIEAKGKEILDGLVPYLKKYSKYTVEVGGHTDIRGRKEKNIQLSQDRANAVKRYLIEHGISSRSLKAKGYGPTKPLYNNQTQEGREKNRRVEFKIISAK